MHIKYLQSVLLVIILLHDNVTGSNLRRRKMLVRRKVAINRNIIARTPTNSTLLVAEEKQIKRPVKVIKRKVLGSELRPVISQLSLPPVLPEAETTTPTASILPQHKPFTVNETVPAKPDAVKRCKFYYV